MPTRTKKNKVDTAARVDCLRQPSQDLEVEVGKIPGKGPTKVPRAGEQKADTVVVRGEKSQETRVRFAKRRENIKRNRVRVGKGRNGESDSVAETADRARIPVMRYDLATGQRLIGGGRGAGPRAGRGVDRFQKGDKKANANNQHHLAQDNRFFRNLVVLLA